MNGIESGQVSEVVNVLLLLFIFGYFYNKKIADLGHKSEGWVWAQVVLGVAVTLIGVGILDMLLDWNALWLGALAFTASGIPMATGAIARHNEAKERAAKAINEISE